MNLQINDNSFYEAQPTCGNPLFMCCRFHYCSIEAQKNKPKILRMASVGKLLVGFSGGETSGFMAQCLKRHKSDKYEMIFVFANTGQENEKTLKAKLLNKIKNNTPFRYA